MRWLRQWFGRPQIEELQARRDDADAAIERLDRQLVDKAWVERRLAQHLRDNHLVERMDAVFRESRT